MKFCEECGAQMEDDALFCDNCGAQSAAAPSEETVAVNKEPKTGAGDRKTAETKKQPVAVVVLGVIVAVLLIVIVMLVAGGRKDKETQKMVDTAVPEASAVTETTETAASVVTEMTETTEPEEETGETESETEKTTRAEKPKEEDTQQERADNPAAYIPEEMYENLGYVDSIDIPGYYVGTGGREYAEISMYSDEFTYSDVGTAMFEICDFQKDEPVFYENLTVYMTREGIYYAVTDDGNVFYFSFYYLDSDTVAMTVYFNDEYRGDWFINEHYYS